MTKVYTLKFDGACKGNPGKGASASVIFENDKILDQSAKYYSHTTNNIAEYKGLLLGLQRAKKLGIKKLKVYGDSNLVVKQIKGEYKVNNPILKEIYLQVIQEMLYFDDISLDHVYRVDNKESDALANLSVELGTDL
jgi:ribonuclease HI